MKRISLCMPLLAIAVCTVAVAEPRASLIGSSVDEAPKISLVGFFGYTRMGGGYGYGYGGGCGCDAAAPSCGVEPSCGAAPACGAEPSCGCGGDYGWDNYCATRHHHRGFGLFHKHRRGCCMPDVTCGCDTAAPSCGFEPSCGAAPTCGAEVADCGCGHHHRHLGHRHCGHCGGGWGGCNYGCGHRCGYGHCKPFRFWANGWCGQVVDGYYTGNPPDCSAPGMMDGMPGKMLPPEPAPMEEPVPAKSTRRLQFPGLSKLPIGIGVR